jgi:hypothetical protein
MGQNKEYIFFENEYLGSVQFSPGVFSREIYAELDSAAFKKLGTFHKHERVNALLLKAILSEKAGSFLMPQVIDFIVYVKNEIPSYHLTSFEFWLGQHLELSEAQKMEVRGKIVGKWIPRSEYQNFFPLQTKGSFPGSHYSYAHISPDLDTTVASFACFLAAFGAKVGDRRHHWMVPGGPPKESMEIEFFFKRALGNEVFTAISSSSTKFSIAALDLISQKNILQKPASTLTYDIDPERGRGAVILVDERGCYLGDWRSVDVDPVRSIIGRFRNFLSEYQNKFVVGIITLFSQDPLELRDWTEFLQVKFSEKFSDSFAARELTEKQRILLDKFIKEVLFIQKGLNSTIGEFFEVAKSFGFAELQAKLEQIKQSSLFDRSGELTENRAHIFRKLEGILLAEKEAFSRFFLYIDSLEAAMEVKRKVLDREPTFLSHTAEYEEIVEAMKDYSHLTVIYHENGTHYPLGVIYAEDVKQKVIATTSWNDFSNPGETEMIEGVDLISVLDHHKSHILTSRPAFTSVRADAQSTNSIIARINFDINDRYSTGGMTLDQIEDGIREISKELDSPSKVRIMQRLLQKKNAALTKGDYSISPDRETLEYLQYIFAMLDDTDLLTKVSPYDLDSMAGLLNRLKSIMLKKEVEIVNFDDLSRGDPNFSKLAAQRLLQTPDLYSLYGVIYKAKEEAIDKVIQETNSDNETHFFQDTKVLGPGSYAAIGQFKHFERNEQILRKHLYEIRKVWVQRSKKTFQERPKVSLHLFMLSTVPSAEELFSGNPAKADYQDELWFWIPEDRKAELQLKSFLQEFSKSIKLDKQVLGIEFLGKSVRHEHHFMEAFAHKEVHFTSVKSDLDMIVLKIEIGSLVSRKTDIAVYL